MLIHRIVHIAPFTLLQPIMLVEVKMHAPTVTTTTRRYDAPRLLKIIVDFFGVRHAFAAGECLRLDPVRQVVGDISTRMFGSFLGDIAGEDFDGYHVEKIAEDRSGVVWWISEST